MRFFSVKGFLLSALVALSLLPATSLPAAAASCQYVLGFKELHNMDSADTGDCVDNQYLGNPNGDQWQHTTGAQGKGGLMVWRKADNWTAFTNGDRTWLNGPSGLQVRANTQVFSWEANPNNLPIVGGGSAALPPIMAAIAPAPAPDAAPVTASSLPPFDSSPDGRFGGIQVSDVPLSNATTLGIGWTREQYILNLLPSPNPALVNSIGTDQHLGPGLRDVGLFNFFPGYCNGGQDKRVPCDNASVTQLAATVAKAKQGKVDSWILYNEPDICNPNNAGYAWTSPNRAVDYLHYAQAAYAGVKSVSPGADVILGSLGITDPGCQTNGDEMTFWNQMLGALGGAPLPADEVSLNIHKEPEKIYDLVKRYHESMQAHGFDKSLWIMEMGIPVQPDPIDPAQNGNLAVNKDNQESFLIQAYANAIAGGADHIGVYKMSDFPPSDPAFATIKTAIKYMSHVTSAVKSPDNRSTGGKYVDRLDGAVTITMKGAGFQTVVAYNRSLTPVSVKIPATSNVAILADKHGGEQQVTPQGGFYNLTLDPVTAWYDAPWGERVRFIGGSPLILRQAA